MTPNQSTSERKLNFIILLLLISAFGPYVFPRLGVRLEQIVIYGLVVLIMFGHLFAVRSCRLNRDLLTIAALFGAAILWTCLPTFFGEYPRLSSERVISGIERFARPGATILIFASAARSLDASALRNTLRLSCLVICLLLGLNSVICAATVFWDTWPLVEFFVRPEVMREQSAGLWQVCVAAGRYSGIFVQPFENGVAHSIGVMAWIYYATSARKMSATLWFLLGMVIIGGLMSVSKAFLLGGLPVGIAYVLFCAPARRAIHWKAAVPAMAILVAGKEVFQSWKGSSKLLAFFGEGESEIDTFQLYTGGRVSEASGVPQAFREIWDAEPLLGFGFGYDYGFAFDNAWLEFFAQGGVAALGIYILILIRLGRLAIKGWRKHYEEGFLFMSLWIIAIGCGFGAPVLTLNRSSTLLWVLVSLCIVIIKPRVSGVRR